MPYNYIHSTDGRRCVSYALLNSTLPTTIYLLLTTYYYYYDDDDDYLIFICNTSYFTSTGIDEVFSLLS